MKHHLLRFWQMVQPGIVNNKQCDEERWALVGKSKKVYSFAVISRPSVCNLYSGTNTQLRLPLSHALITAHISISWYLVIFSKTLSPEIFSSFIFLCQGQLNDNRDPAGVGLSVPFIYCRVIPNWGGVFAKSRVAVDCWGWGSSWVLRCSTVWRWWCQKSQNSQIFWQTLWSKVLHKNVFMLYDDDDDPGILLNQIDMKWTLFLPLIKVAFMIYDQIKPLRSRDDPTFPEASLRR